MGHPRRSEGQDGETSITRVPHKHREKVAVHVQVRGDFLLRLIIRSCAHSADCEFPGTVLVNLSSSAAYILYTM
jgi:hypothetical protein